MNNGMGASSPPHGLLVGRKHALRGVKRIMKNQLRLFLKYALTMGPMLACAGCVADAVSGSTASTKINLSEDAWEQLHAVSAPAVVQRGPLADSGFPQCWTTPRGGAVVSDLSVGQEIQVTLARAVTTHSAQPFRIAYMMVPVTTPSLRCWVEYKYLQNPMNIASPKPNEVAPLDLPALRSCISENSEDTKDQLDCVQSQLDDDAITATTQGGRGDVRQIKHCLRGGGGEACATPASTWYSWELFEEIPI